MRDWFGRMLYGMAEVWRSIGLSQRVSIIMIMLVAIFALSAVVFVGSRPDFAVLYSNMNNETAQKMIELVEGEGIKYKTRDDGRTILVPRREVSRLKGRARGAGIEVGTDGPKGWGLFNNNELGMSQEQLRIKTQRAKQGEVERMLNSLPGVKRAKVELATPPRRAFYRKGQNQRPTASVLLVMHSGRMMTPQQVTTVRHQVAGAIDGLLPGDVTVSDNYGRLLARRSQDGGMPGSDPNSQIEIKEQIELQLQEKAEAILRPFVGMNNVIAMVTAEVDFDKVETIAEKYDRENRAAVQEKIVSEENTRSGGRSGGGPAGVQSNNTVAVANPGANQATKSEQSQKTTKTTESTYVIPKTTERKNKTGARIKSISVAVSIAQNGETPRPQAELDKYKKLVESAVGAVTTTERKDSVAVVENAFAPPTTPEAGSRPIIDRAQEQFEKLTGSPIMRVVIGLILLAILYKVFRSQFTDADIRQADVQAGIYGEDLYIPPEPEARQLEAEEVPLTPIDFVQERSDRNPAMIAQAIESWLRREDG